MIAEYGLNHPEQKSIVLAGENWHSGVLGIVASRIAEKFYRPTIMINASDKIEAAHINLPPEIFFTQLLRVPAVRFPVFICSAQLGPAGII